MKKVMIVFMLSLFFATTLSAQKYSISVPRFARPLVEQWVADYKKVEPGVQFNILQGCGCMSDATLSVLPYAQESASPNNVVYFASYVILPFTQKDSEAQKLLNSKRLSIKRLRHLFFEHDLYGDDEDETTKFEKQLKRLTVLSANNGAPLAVPFAQFFQEDVNNIRGRRISGDDAFLTTAVKKDPKAVSFNALSNLYDLDSRRLKDGIALLRLDINKELENGIEQEATIDELMNLIRQNPAKEIPVGKVGFVYNGYQDDVNRFLLWVLTQGKDSLTRYGLLDISDDLAEQQISKVSTQFTAQNQ